MHDLEKLTHTVIEKGYPELRGKIIAVSWADLTKDFEDAVLYYTELYPNPEEYEMALDERIQNAPVEATLGYLAHELSHLVRFVTKGFYQRLIYVNLYLELKASPKELEAPNHLMPLINAYTRLDERQTDTLAVERGFGQELLDLLAFQKKNPVPNAPKNEGLTAQEIHKLMKKMEQQRRNTPTQVSERTQSRAIDTSLTPSSIESPANQSTQPS